MKRGLLLGACALTTSYQTHHLLTSAHMLTATNLLEISALLCLTVTFLWYSLSYILLHIGEKRRHIGLLTFIARCGSPRTRQLATIALLLTPVSACSLTNVGNNDVDSPVAITQTVATESINYEELTAKTTQQFQKSQQLQQSQQLQHQTPEHLQRGLLKPAILQKINTATKTVTVTPGDCLWSIAERLNPQFSPPELTQFVQRMYRQNAYQITDPSIIYPGQILQLPTTER